MYIHTNPGERLGFVYYLPLKQEQFPFTPVLLPKENSQSAMMMSI
jgi:hypothetical protein